MLVGSSGQGMALTQKVQVQGGHGALLRKKTAVFGVRLWRIIMRRRQKCELQLPLPFAMPVVSSQSSLEDGSAVFSNESTFCLSTSDGRVLVRRRPGECLQPRHAGPTPEYCYLLTAFKEEDNQQDTLTLTVLF
ncbi:DDE_3 domain-containing protein [Trichonephila clavipes]|nr:DDE_3 domain-containing protein [Trichonephila clavipes]